MGALVDKIGQSWLLDLGLVVSSLAPTAGGLVSAFGWLVIKRMVLGIGEVWRKPGAR